MEGQAAREKDMPHGHSTRPLLCTGDGGGNAVISFTSNTSEHQACYAFAAWLLGHAKEATQGYSTQLSTAFQVCNGA